MHLEAVVHAHAAAFIGRSPDDVARDDALLADAHKTAWQCYRHRQVMPAIDPLAVEVEAWSEAAGGTPPLFGSVGELRELPDLDPEKNARLGIVLSAARRLFGEVPATISVPVAGPLTIAAALVGRKAMLRDILRDGRAARAALLGLVPKQQAWLRAIAACGARVSVCELPYSPGEIAPEIFSEVVEPALAELIRAAHAETRHAPSLLIDGDTAPIARALCRTGAGLVVCPAETDRAAFLEQAREFRDTIVRVDFASSLWSDGDWPKICATISGARGAARIHARTIFGTGALPLGTSSVLIVDACNFAMSMDSWLDPT